MGKISYSNAVLLAKTVVQVREGCKIQCSHIPGPDYSADLKKTADSGPVYWAFCPTCRTLYELNPGDVG